MGCVYSYTHWPWHLQSWLESVYLPPTPLHPPTHTHTYADLDISKCSWEVSGGAADAQVVQEVLRLLRKMRIGQKHSGPTVK